MMERIDPTSRQFLQLLQASLWKRTVPDVTPESDWKALLKLARIQAVQGMVADAVVNLPSERQPEPGLMKELRLFLMKNVQLHTLLNSVLAETVACLEKNGVYPVLLKGQGMAEEYPDPIVRQCGDIDLYIGVKDYDKACGLIRELAGEEAAEQAVDSVKHYHIAHRKVTIELHRVSEILNVPEYNRCYAEWADRLLERSRLRSFEACGTEVHVPPVEFNALYVFSHIWHHFMSGGIGLRQLCDWALCLHNHCDEIDRKALEVAIRRIGLMKPWQTFGCVLVDGLGMEATEFPFYDATYSKPAEAVLERILSEGNFGFQTDMYRKRPKSYLSGKLHSFRCHTKRFTELFSLSPTYALWNYWGMLETGIKAVVKGK